MVTEEKPAVVNIVKNVLGAGVGMVGGGHIVEHQQHARDRLHAEDKQQNRPEDIGPARAARDRLIEHLGGKQLQPDPLIDKGEDFFCNRWLRAGRRSVAHLNDPRLGLRPGFEFHIDNLHLATRGHLNRQQVERTWGGAIQHLAGCIIDAQVAGAEEDLSKHLVFSPFICAPEVGTFAGKCEVGHVFLIGPDGFPGWHPGIPYPSPDTPFPAPHESP